MRVLIVGNAHERFLGQRFYSVEHKLANGFNRNGHLVYFFSDRDVARSGSIFKSSRAGRGIANAKFLDVVRNFAPDLIVSTHSSLISTENFAETKRLPSRPRLAQTCVDPLFREVNVSFLKDRSPVFDATFVTTAGEALAQFSTPANVTSYMPNPVDASIETSRGFERSDQPFDVFFAANAGGDRPDDARRATPALIAETPGVASDFHGFDGRPPLIGTPYFRRLAESRMALNINSDRSETAPRRAPEAELYLYNSDRISQLMGCGLLALSFRVNKLFEIFDEDKEMSFSETPEAMRDAVLRFKREDGLRRQIAEAGWRKSHQELNERLVARYIEEVAFRRPLSNAYIWPTRLW
jgi:Glycosyl transferases group 1